MAAFSTSCCFTLLTVLIFNFKILAAEPDSSFSFKSFGRDPSFEANIALYGDAKVLDGGSSVQLTNSVSSSAGRVMYKKPIRLLEGKTRNLASFSTYFSFSLSGDNDDGLAFVMLPSGFNVSLFGNSSFGSKNKKASVLAVEFGAVKDTNYGDLNENHVGINVRSLVSAKVRNLLNSGEKLHSWIDYEASSKRLEVRLSKGDKKPVDSLLSYPIELSQMWNDKEAFVGLSCSNGTCYVYSWSFKLRHFPHWMHSQPLDPKTFANNTKPVKVQKRSDCLLKMLAALILGAACGAMGALVVLYLWTIFGSRRPVMPEEFNYNEVKVVVDNNKKCVEDGKK
ncbi:L-type lectin-domain containing receptor kinase S.4-like [Carica papaya]|uniref:L-type lectin-domain containing receptor kinase S.4-like n=1 Tax=Carica papaya TaxID=3649 RepID=UPI000B8D178D|nr:L-type lectin-domain containing receptor kinase S.4-like [Carica papaya]